MLERESFGAGWQVTLRPRGAGRFIVAAFLGFWLCGWAAGETFAAGTLIAGLRQLLAPELDVAWLPRMTNLPPANAWPVLAFLAVWLTFWTVGGLFAIAEVLRAFVGADVVRWDHEGVEFERRAGPFVSRRRLRWSEMREPLARSRGRLVADTRRGVAPLAALGDDADREQLAAWLAQAWREARGGEGESRESREHAPRGWRVETGEDGRPLLASDPHARRAGAFVVGLLAGVFGLVAALVGGAAAGLASWAGAAVLGTVALLAAAAAAWLALGRDELRPAHGSLRRVRRFLGREQVREFAPARLRLERGRDSDGDERWALVVSGPDGSLELASDLHAPGAARHLGAWLAARMDVTLEGLPDEPAEARRAG